MRKLAHIAHDPHLLSGLPLERRFTAEPRSRSKSLRLSDCPSWPSSSASFSASERITRRAFILPFYGGRTRQDTRRDTRPGTSFIRHSRALHARLRFKNNIPRDDANENNDNEMPRIVADAIVVVYCCARCHVDVCVPLCAPASSSGRRSQKGPARRRDAH